MVDTREKREARHKLIVEARGLVDKADAEKRAFSAEDRQQYDRLMGEAEKARVEIEDLERRNDLERQELAEKTRLEREKAEEERRKKAEEEERRKKKDAKTETTGGYRSQPEYRAAFTKWLVSGWEALDEAETRALSAGTATEGGYLYASEQFVNELIANVTDATIMRQLCRGFRITTADSIAVPTLPDRMAAAAWTSELGVPSTDSTLAFGKRMLTPHPLAKEIQVSKVLLRKVPAAEALVRDELARVVAEANENGFMTGDGAQQPLGVFTASDDGISTDRDVSTGNSASSPTFDGLKAAKYELKQAYWAAAQWIFHRDIMELIAKLKDGNGRYLLQDSVVQGEPDRMLGFPVRLSEFAPSTISSGAYVGILGDFANYWIVDSMAVEIAVARELYIRNNKDLFVVRMETDGAPIREEAFVRVKLG